MKNLTKKDYRNLTIILTPAFIFIIVLFLSGNIFGSNIDWISQHYAIPEYFRNLFYQDYNLFPNFASNLGLGQNIFYLSYYGLFSPIILLAYLLPFIPMYIYIQVVTIIMYVMSVCLMYSWLKNKYDGRALFMTTMLFALSGPLLFHAHRHFMFVIYLPFLIKSLMLIDEYFEGNKKSILIVLNVLAMILINYYYSFAGIVVIGIYTIYKVLEKNKKINYKSFKPLLKIVSYVILSILLSSFLLFPTINTLITGRIESNVSLNIIGLIFSKLKYNLTFYHAYSLGLTFIYVFSLIYTLIQKQKEKLFLGIILLLCMLVPFFSYIFNGFMYVDGKVFIPFLPLAMILLANFIDNLYARKIDLKKLFIYMTPITLFMIYSAIGYNKLYLLIIDIILMLFVIYLAYKKEMKICLLIFVVPMFSFISLNISDNFVKQSQISDLNEPVIKELLNKLPNDNYRVAIMDNILANVNRIYNINQNISSIYSSTANKHYAKLVRDIFQNEIINKDKATYTQTSNILFNIYTGTKYIITSNQNYLGYETIINNGDLHLLENKEVLPTIYYSKLLMSEKEFSTLKYPYNLDALLNYIIVPEELPNTYKSNVNKINLSLEETLKKNLSYELIDKQIHLQAKKENELVLKINNDLKNKILIIKFKMAQEKKGYGCSSEIVINGQINSLACNNWKYHNNNYTFEYVLGSNEPLTELKVKFSEDDFIIENIEAYTIDYKMITYLNKKVIPVEYNKSKTNEYKGTIETKETGYIKTTIPYEKEGFKLVVNNKKQNIVLVDQAFIGFKVEPGVNNFILTYEPPLYSLGKIISLLSLIPLIILMFKNKIIANKKKILKQLTKYKNLLIKFYNYLLHKSNLRFYILIGIPFILLDIFTRILSSKVDFFNVYAFVPNAFTFVWVYLFIGIASCVKKNNGKLLYILFYSISLIFYFINNVYYSMSGSFFDFSLLALASEGSEYFIDTLVNANIWIYLLGILNILLFIYAYKKLKFPKVTKYKPMIFIFSSFLIAHFIIPAFLGQPNLELTWNTWRNPRNIYDNFNDNNKSLSVSGLYEYTYRNFYVTYIKKKKTVDEKEVEFLDNIFSEYKLNPKNKYTGRFKDKNIIFLQLEGIDNWVLNKANMPNTYALLNNSINFTNHYSYYNGGGSTFNSEFAVNTGYLTPITYTQNAYTFNKNHFPDSMAKIFNNIGYKANVFHMNSGEYYSRKINYLTWGYENYYGLKDLGEYNNDDYRLDTELINNELFYEKQFKSEGKFINYLITYTLHMPFNQDKGMCNYILKKSEKEIDPDNPLSEEDCIKIQAKETDDMVGLLMQALKDNNLEDKTIIVAYADHYLYTLADKTTLDKYKNTETNLINKTPFFIWSKNQKKVNIKEVTAQLNILPTVLNLMGVDFNPNYYTGADALAKNYKGIAFFNDYSWYDGKYYYADEKLIIGKTNNLDLIEEKNSYVYYLIKKNDLILKYNYFKRMKKVELENVK